MLAILILLAGADLVGKCVSVKDGDTIVVLHEGRQVVVRLAGIDAPERKQPFGTTSREALASLIHEREVRVVCSGRDRYGRTIGTVYVGETNVNERMVESGMAWHFTRYSKSKRLEILEHDAREFRRGLWRDPEPVEPWVWRKAKK